jgi:hypothetical protein
MDIQVLTLQTKKRNIDCSVWSHTYHLSELHQGGKASLEDLFALTLTTAHLHSDGTLTDKEEILSCWCAGGRGAVPISAISIDRTQRGVAADVVRYHAAFYVVDPTAEAAWKRGQTPLLETRVEFLVHLNTGYIEVRISGPLEPTEDQVGHRVLCNLTLARPVRYMARS